MITDKLTQYRLQTINESIKQGNLYTGTQIQNIIRKAGLPLNTAFYYLFLKELFDTHTGNRRKGECNKYSFKYKHLDGEKLQQMLKDNTKFVKEQVRKYYPNREERIRQAIALLKEEGYLIQKRVITYEEV